MAMTSTASGIQQKNLPVFVHLDPMNVMALVGEESCKHIRKHAFLASEMLCILSTDLYGHRLSKVSNEHIT